MTKQEFHEFYQRSVYQERLAMMERFVDQGMTFSAALEEADNFVTKLLAEKREELKAKYG